MHCSMPIWLDEAAKLLITRLRDPALRSDALVDAQEFLKPVPTPANLVLHERRHALLARKDVRAVVAKYGRTEQFLLPP
jgi:hypothetical protein